MKSALGKVLPNSQVQTLEALVFSCLFIFLFILSFFSFIWLSKAMAGLKQNK